VGHHQHAVEPTLVVVDAPEAVLASHFIEHVLLNKSLLVLINPAELVPHVDVRLGIVVVVFVRIVEHGELNLFAQLFSLAAEFVEAFLGDP
jgi:hypothetical protein